MSIALLVDKVAEIAIIFNPILDQLFTARRGQGTFYNGKQVHVSGQTDIGKALVTTELGTSRDAEKFAVTLDNFEKVANAAQG